MLRLFEFPFFIHEQFSKATLVSILPLRLRILFLLNCFKQKTTYCLFCIENIRFLSCNFGYLRRLHIFSQYHTICQSTSTLSRRTQDLSELLFVLTILLNHYKFRYQKAFFSILNFLFLSQKHFY